MFGAANSAVDLADKPLPPEKSLQNEAILKSRIESLRTLWPTGSEPSVGATGQIARLVIV